MMNRIGVLATKVLLLGAIATADDSDFAANALHAVNNIPWSRITVKILNEEGHAIEGAIVCPWALRAGNGHGWWTPERYGAPCRTTTELNGETAVVFPKSSGNEDLDPVTQVSIYVSHSDFCSKSVHVDIPAADSDVVPTVTLERGVRLRVAGVKPGTVEPLSDCHVLLEGRETGDPEFVPQKDGWLQSVPIRDNRRWFRVVRMAPGEPIEFSQPSAWSADDPASREVRVELRPGARVRGRVSDSVARPIERGHVVAWCGSPASSHGENPQQGRSITWIETVPIAKDGTFEFPSLPNGYLAQFYAIANDFISAQPSDEAYATCCKWFGGEIQPRNNFFRYGQVLRLAGSKSQITLEMEPSCQVRVKCVDPAGQPLKGVMVSTWPNQFIVGGGSTVFCWALSSAAQLQSNARPDWLKGNPYLMETNAAGEALLRNLPAGNQNIVARNDFWKSKPMDNLAVQLDSITEIELVLQRAR